MKFKRFAAVMLTAVLAVTAFPPVAAQAEYYDDDGNYVYDSDDYDYSWGSDDDSDDYYNSDDDYSWDEDDTYQEPDYSQLGLAETSKELKANYGYDGYTSSGSIQLTGVPANADLSYYDVEDMTSSNPDISFDDYGLDADNYSLSFDVYGTGTTTVSFSIKGKQLSFTLTVTPKYDLSGMKLAKSSLIMVAGNEWGSSDQSVKLKGIPSEALSDEDFDFEVTDVDSSNSSMDVSVDLDSENGTVNFSTYDSGSTTVTFKIDGIQFSIKIRVITASIKKDSYYLARGKSVKLKIKGSLKGVKVKYKSLSPRVASINSKGKVKAKKSGTAVIKVTIGDGDNSAAIGTVINVASAKKIKAFNWARRYASKNTYSQPKRMQKGYYDCSSLVWKAYRTQGRYLEYRSYAPTAAGLGEYLVKKGKKVASASWNNYEKRKFQVGDLLFETGANNGRYKGIYHVEMFGGYSFGDFDSNGKPYLNYTFANIQEGSDSSNFLCRP